MNKEYYVSSQDKLLVTNEVGEIREIKLEGNYGQVLVLENNLEYIDEIIDSLEAFINSKTEVKFDPFNAKFTLVFFGVPTAAFYFTGNTEDALILGIIGLLNIALDPVGKYVASLIKSKNEDKIREAYKIVVLKAKEIREELVKKIEECKKEPTIIPQRKELIQKVSSDKDFNNKVCNALNDEYKNNITRKRLQNRYNCWQ